MAPSRIRKYGRCQKDSRVCVSELHANALWYRCPLRVDENGDTSFMHALGRMRLGLDGLRVVGKVGQAKDAKQGKTCWPSASIKY
jgi:hypothetical protein